ncbi:Neuronal acetylcholine receptor subunit alpha-10 [Nymphon striatum]|nr:Neuronal acetylcholine receptor subunit alpha-10 [Nymphon striatum]
MGDRLINLRFAEDVVLLSESPQELQLMVEELRTASNKVETYRLERKLYSSIPYFDSRSHPNDTAVVRFGITVLNLNVDEPSGVVVVQGNAVFVWKVSYLTWNPDDYGGLKSISIPTYRIWTPDIVPFNGKAGDTWNHDTIYHTTRSLTLYSDGVAVWAYPTQIPFYCSFDHTNYPYDEQKCKLIMGSWLYVANELDLQPIFDAKYTFGYYKDQNPNWSLKNYSKVRNYIEQYKYVDITFTLLLKRRFAMYGATLVTPLGVAAFLALLMFWIPAWHPRKISTGCVAVFIVVALLTHLSWKLPPTLKEPKIVMMCKTTLYAVCASLLSSIILMNFNKNSFSCINEPPAFLVSILQGIVGKIFCICDAETNATTHSAYRRSALDGSEDKVYVGDVSCQDDVDRWKLVSLFIDRVLFIVFVITFVITTAQ